VLIDKSHKRWGLLTGASFVLSGIAYWLYARGTVGGPRGGSVPGLWFGIAGSTLMVFAGLIAARKRVPKWRIGSAQFWLRGHLWLGTLSIPLILFHAGFRWGGLLEQLLLLVLAGVVASGAFGLLLQQVLPRQMTARVPLETFYAQVPHVCDVLQVEGDVTVADTCGPLPIAPNTQVATIELLDRLGVKEKREVGKKQDLVKDKGKEKSTEEVEQEKLRKLLASVYDPPRDSEPAAPMSGKVEAEVPKATAKAMAKPPAKAEETPAATMEQAPAPVESAASFNPKMGTRAAGLATVALSSAPAEAPAKPLSPAEKIALMRSKKQMPKAEAIPASTDELAPAPVESAASINPEPSSTVALSSAPAAEPAKPLSPAEKIALMRAKKPPVKAEAAPAATAELAPASTAPAAPAEAPQTGKAMTAAEKIALMKAKKAPAGGATVVAPVVPAVAKSVAAPRKQQQPPVDDAWKELCPELKRFYVADVRPFLGRDFPHGGPLADGTAADGCFALERLRLPSELHETLDSLSQLCEERRQLAAQARIHHWLHGWLFLHVGLSMALLGLGAVHAVMSIYY